VADEKPTLAPTPTRIRLARDIKAGRIKRFHWEKPWTCRTYDDRNVTEWVGWFVVYELAEYGQPEPYEEPLISGTRNYSIVSLTPDGEDWLTKYGSTDE